ncbi:MAG: hypothetical protein Ct9H300mP7_6410 [Verrucomicrobiota bacterium]|nr:MAG: hypothetical protein Ct9H300mP7_6410 [Verrucomicrobiota bacterium]
MIHFAWAGSLESGKGHYYRIQAPDLLIEYDNTQNGANHVHCVVRDLKRDFGEDLLPGTLRAAPQKVGAFLITAFRKVNGTGNVPRPWPFSPGA